MNQIVIQQTPFEPACWELLGEVNLTFASPVPQDVYAPERWGLSDEAIADLPNRLRRYWARFRRHFKSKTRDSSESAWVYLQGLLLTPARRNFANIARRVIGVEDDGQAIQHFMSDSPWEGRAVIQQVQQEIASTPELGTGGVLLLDESADDKAGEQSVGAGRQHNGRLGKVEMSQVGTFLAFYKGVVWTWVDGELFLPKHWFGPKMAEARKRLGVPPDRQFATKIELGWQMIQRAKVNGLPFEAVACDDLYGRSGWLRHQMDQAGIVYMAEVPADTQVYLTKPKFGIPARKPGQRRGRKPTRPRVLSRAKPVEVRQIAERSDTRFECIFVRHAERGELADPFALPALSVSNVRELLQATMPLDHLSPEQATNLVVKHLVNRSRSTSSRLKAQRLERGPP